MNGNSNLDVLPSFFVGVTPSDYDAERLSAERCKALVLGNQVRFRGWSFPYARDASIVAGSNSAYVEQSTDSQGFAIRHLERWRMYRSGQFLFSALVWEYSNEELQRKAREEFQWSLHGAKLREDPPGYLSFIIVIYWITEAYVFASRLAQSVPYSTPVEIRVGYRNINGWALTSTQPEYSLDEIYICKRYPFSVKPVEVDRLVGDPLGCASEAIISIFQQFEWMEPSARMIAQHQLSIVK